MEYLYVRPPTVKMMALHTPASRDDFVRILAIAHSVRAALPAFAKRHEVPYGDGFGGLCSLAADGVTMALREAGIAAQYVVGEFCSGARMADEGHCWTWLPRLGLVVDTTAEQFNSGYPWSRPLRRMWPVEVADARSVVSTCQRGVLGWHPAAFDESAERLMRRDGWGEDFMPGMYRRSKWWRGRRMSDAVV